MSRQKQTDEETNGPYLIKTLQLQAKPRCAMQMQMQIDAGRQLLGR